LDEPKIIRLIDPDDPLTGQALDLYQNSFPVEEIDPIDGIQLGMRRQLEGRPEVNRAWRFLAAVNCGRVVGMSMYTYYRDTRLAFLFYLATQPDLRGQGLGAWLFRQTRDRLAGDAFDLKGLPPLGMCWEVERPEIGQSPDEVELRKRRINFYRRIGAILLDEIEFIAPPIDDGQPPVPYYLMYLPVDTQAGPVDKHLLKSVIDSILLYGYDEGPDSEYYLNAIASLNAYVEATGGKV
jgi:GNAT superfamily N-acetyltransferase